MLRKAIIVLISSFIFFTHHVFAQPVSSADNFTVIQKIPVVFTFSDIDEMLKEKVIHSAFEIKLAASLQKTDVYVSLVAGSTLQQAMGIKLNLNGVSSMIAGNPDEVILGRIPVKLFSFLKTQADGDISVSYDIILHAAKTFIQPGSYKFDIVFSSAPL